ncbi:MAG: hypothetical protein CM15mP74_08620 [Halieaceae bacterium]|nr:MAG: hypothetical protein CM15mP74_08620 [Halieaceae bacterium]
MVTVSVGGDGGSITLAGGPRAPPRPATVVFRSPDGDPTICRPASKRFAQPQHCLTLTVSTLRVCRHTTSCVTCGSEAAPRKYLPFRRWSGSLPRRKAYTGCPSSLCPAKPGLMGENLVAFIEQELHHTMAGSVRPGAGPTKAIPFYLTQSNWAMASSDSRRMDD